MKLMNMPTPQRSLIDPKQLVTDFVCRLLLCVKNIKHELMISVVSVF